jgi:hypothetical protein
MTPAEKRIDHIESVCEELNMNGFKCFVVNHKIQFGSMFGTMNYDCSEKTVLGDYYRFISHFGIKLHNYGLEKKLEENLKQFKQ